MEVKYKLTIEYDNHNSTPPDGLLIVDEGGDQIELYLPDTDRILTISKRELLNIASSMRITSNLAE